MKIKKTILFFSVAFLFVLISSNVLALSNKSIEAESLLGKAKVCLTQIAEFNLPLARANSSYQEANNLYQGQITLEKMGKFANYEKINELSLEVCSIEKTATKASDELKVFLDTYEKISKEVNLSEIEDNIIKTNNSFYEERFEDTLVLIDEGYAKISEVQAKQTAVNAFYTATSKTLKNFILENWIIILIVLTAGTFSLIYFWKAIRRYFLKAKLEHLGAQKGAINSLIAKLQKEYFETKIISESEFFTKINKYKDMLLDIDRQAPLIREELEKVKEKEIRILKKEDSLKQSAKGGIKDVKKETKISKDKKRTEQRIRK